MPPSSGISDLAKALTAVTARAEALVREEIELAKAEISEKIGKLIRGLVIGIAAGIFIFFGMIYLLNAAAWGIWQATGLNQQFWIGFATVGIALFLLAGLAGYIAYRLFRKATPPTPKLAIKEASLIKESVVGAKEADS